MAQEEESRKAEETAAAAAVAAASVGEMGGKTTPDKVVEDTETKTDVPPHADEPAAKKKRSAGRQITKDDDDSDSSTEMLTTGGFKKANAEVMKKRKIVRARWRGGEASTATAPIPTAKTSAPTDEKKEKESTDKPGDDVDKEVKDEIDSKNSISEKKEEKASNPFAAVSFSSAVGTNPFAAAFAKSKTSSNNNSSGFGSFTESGGFGASFGSGGFGSKNNEQKPLFGSSSSGMLFGQSTKTGFGSTTGFMGATAPTKMGSNKSSFFQSKSNVTTPFGLSKNEKEDDDVGHNKHEDEEKIDKEKQQQLEKEEEESLMLSNGEEGFESIFETRAKLFKRMPVEEKKKDLDENTAGATQSVPPSASSNIGTQSVPPTSNGNAGEEKTNKNGVPNENDKDTLNATKMDWKEVGIGPVRILKSIEDNSVNDSNKNEEENASSDKSTTCVSVNRLRVVQRRESTIGGHGTKLILNLNLRAECLVTRQAEKYVRLAAFEIDNGIDIDNKDSTTDEQLQDEHKITPVNYLFRVKTVAEGDELENALEDAIKVCTN